MKFYSTFIFLFFSATFFSQAKTSRDISIKKNSDWIREFEEKKGKLEKLNLIIEKVKLDSIIDYNPVITYISKTGHIHDSIDSSKSCKILFILNQKRYMWLLDLNQFPKYSKILKYIDVNEIKRIEVLSERASIASFGQRGACGVIMIKSNNRKLKRLFKKASKK